MCYYMTRLPKGNVNVFNTYSVIFQNLRCHIINFNVKNRDQKKQLD